MYPRTSTQTFTVYPAIDLRKGQVVGRQTVYDSNPASVARRWVKAGARWLHVTNLDAAQGADNPYTQEALTAVLKAAKSGGARTQIGGGLNSLDQVARVLNMGYNRAVLGSAAVRQPFILAAALDRWGPERIAVHLDVCAGGWSEPPAEETRPASSPLALARWFAQMGLRWLVVTGSDAAADLADLAALSEATPLNVIAAGADSLEDV
ncbi:MAG TPA: HisA/HisF-related TIM barrel protein, partial [Anaerolineaceae bacterium]|nr:HisA/HisF-related TIM barrel protein [Anaerolineaceae bacterium]